MRQLLWVGHRADRLDLTFEDLQHPRGEDPAVAIPDDGAGLAVQLVLLQCRAQREQRCDGVREQQRATVRTIGPTGASGDSAAVVDRRDIGRQEGLQCLDIAVLKGGEESLGELRSFPAVSLEARASGIDVATGARAQLAARALRPVHDGGDPGVVEAEDVVQDEDRSLQWTEPLEQHE